MGFEPNAANRLRLLYSSTNDPALRSDLETLLPKGSSRSRMTHASVHPTLDDEGNGNGNGRPAFSSSVSDFVTDLLSEKEAHAELLNAFGAQAKAVQLVYEAYRRGAVDLPPSVLEAVTRARTLPRFLLELHHSG